MRRWILSLAFGIIFQTSLGYADEVKSLYDSHGKRDPFMPLVSLTARQAAGLLSVQNIEDLRVEGIVHDPKGSMVIVNGSLMKEGEEAASVKVVDVQAAGATFLVNGVEAFVPIYKEESKG
ncbi:MAG: hypothetical protein HY592_00200 [Candidatus Omnitrophica bacterium]|nr:hypothetical protein [Candidatus Omnitrophota bacterium]